MLVGPEGRDPPGARGARAGGRPARAGGQSARLHLDVGGYRERRREALAAFAEQVADEVRESGTERALEPMTPPDRKVVHDTVAEIDGVETTSEGEEPRRRVVISPLERDRLAAAASRTRTRSLVALERARARGFLGPGPVAAAPRPRLGFGVVAQEVLGGVPARVVDLGTGGGVPGLVLAVDWPEARWLLVDAAAPSGRRLVAVAVQELGLVEPVEVSTARAEDAGRTSRTSASRRSGDRPELRARRPSPRRSRTGLVAVGRLGGRQRAARTATRTAGRRRTWPGSGSARPRCRSWAGAHYVALPKRAAAPAGAPAPDATPRQAPGLVGPRPGLANATDRSTFHVERRPIRARQRSVVVRPAPLFHVERRATVSAEPGERPSQGTRGRRSTDLEARMASR